ncbi:MAG: circadian clock protein KaiB [Ilumatobacteraceae bacterium]|jgi:circadian clock protein KaiB|nr:circadian clock protein KaiB [Ilumatobacteraceae bacterium]
MTASAGEAVNGFELTVETEEVFYELTLFVSGASALAARAIANARRLCDLHCNGHYHLSVVDIHEDPGSLLTDNLLATPTLIKYLPPPVRRVVGDLSHTEKVLMTLDLPPSPGLSERSAEPS